MKTFPLQLRSSSSERLPPRRTRRSCTSYIDAVEGLKKNTIMESVWYYRKYSIVVMRFLFIFVLPELLTELWAIHSFPQAAGSLPLSTPVCVKCYNQTHLSIITIISMIVTITITITITTFRDLFLIALCISSSSLSTRLTWCPLGIS